jgi:cyclophilin family peptidyl-prolyl cis-trans isomerase
MPTHVGRFPSRRRRAPTAPTAALSPPLPRRAALRLAAFAALAVPLRRARAGTSADAPIDPRTDMPEITARVYFDLSVSGGRVRRFVVGCFGALLPETVGNFVALARKRVGEGGYAGSDVYRIVPGLTVQMGDVLENGGRSGRAASGSVIPAEGLRVKHTVPGIVSMARGKGGAVDSRFFVATRPGDSGYLDVEGRAYVAFGIVDEGYELFRELEAVGSRGGDSRPLAPIRIVGCGVL